MQRDTTRDEPSVARGEPRYEALQGLRILSVLTILSNHWSDYLYVGLIPQQQIAIDAFFIVEGFLAARQLDRSCRQVGGWRLLWQRLLRVYPSYLIGLAAGAAATAPLAQANLAGWTMPELLRAVATGTIGWPIFPSYAEGAVFPLNWPSWAIVLEVWAFVALYAQRQRSSLLSLSIICAGAAIGLVALSAHWHDTNLGWQARGFWGGLPRVVFGFFGGALLHGVVRKYGALPFRLNAIYAWILFVVTLFVKVPLVGLPLQLVVMPLLVWLGALSTCPACLTGFLQRAGRYVYPMYLLHFPVLTEFKAVGSRLGVAGHHMASLMSYILALALVVLASHLVVRLIDDPLRRKFDPAHDDERLR